MSLLDTRSCVTYCIHHVLIGSLFFYKHIGRIVDAELFSSKKCFRINTFLAYSKQVGKTNVLDMDAFTIKSVEII